MTVKTWSVIRENAPPELGGFLWLSQKAHPSEQILALHQSGWILLQMCNSLTLGVFTFFGLWFPFIESRPECSEGSLISDGG